MNQKEMTPSESLALIAQTIQEAQARFKENGFAFVFLGLCIAVASFTQFILIKLKFYDLLMSPFFIMPLAAALTFWYYKKKVGRAMPRNAIGMGLSTLGIVLGINLMIAGFFFYHKFGAAMFPLVFILLSLWLIISGVQLKYFMFLVAEIFMNAVAYLSFYIQQEFLPLLFAVTSLAGIVLPGIMLMYSNQKSHV
jgi:hypothetical protein